MAKILTSYVEVPFAPDGGTGASNLIIWETDEERESDDIRETWVRLYPIDVPVVVTTSGTLSSNGRHTKSGEDYVIFSGSNAVASPYPNIYNVTVFLLGKFYDNDGNVIPGVTVSYDPNRQQIIASSEGYGIAKLVYTVDYVSYLYQFAGVGCPDSPLSPIPEGKPFDDAILVGMDPAKAAVGTHNLESPECEKKSLIVNRQAGAKVPTIDLIIDPEYPIRLIAGSCPNIICQGCRVRHIPAISSTVKVSSGTIEEIEPGVVNYQEVNELVLFSGSSSVNITYQAHSKPNFVGHGTFRNKWGSSVSPEFRGAGERVTEVDRPSEHTRTNPRSRIVADDEVVAVDMWGNTIEVFGVLEASYVYSYRLFEVELGYNTETDEFETTFMTALRSGSADEIDEPATLVLTPVSMKGQT